jgi:HK97 family phage prohead protease
MLTKSIDVTIEKSSSAEFDARFIMSATSPDRVKDTIEESAYSPNLGKKLIALYQHDSDKPIGFWDNLRVETGKLMGDIKFASTNLAQMCKTLIEDGVPLGASIGFRGKGEQNDKGGIHFKTVELLECSVVSVPCHPAAMQVAKKFGIDLQSSEIDPGTVVADRQEEALERAKKAILAANRNLRNSK